MCMKNIYNGSMSDDNAFTFNCILADLPQLADRREQLTMSFFVKMEDIL